MRRRIARRLHRLARRINPPPSGAEAIRTAVQQMNQVMRHLDATE